ncbi:hypothetical protein SLA2020_471780 [Shorea laevis]
MGSYGLLESTLKEILEAIKPLGEDRLTRDRVIADLRQVVQSLEDFRGATVEPFGSFVSNLFTRWGDLDISIELPNGSHISSSSKRRKRSLLDLLFRVLRQRGGWNRLQFISRATVPILKFVSSPHGISCDVSIDNLEGQMKSKFLLWINEIDGRFREMVLLVKEWAKAYDINDPKNGTLNSYSLSLLVIFHFQTCLPAILPPLRYLYPGNLVDDLTGVRAVAERRIAEVCATNIARFKSDRSRLLNRSSLSELFVSFIAKYRDINSKAHQLGIFPFTGQWESLSSNTRWLLRNKALFIEDPFEQASNTARTVSLNNLTKISEAFVTTHRKLVSGNQTRNSLLATLARPHIFPFNTNGPVNYSRYNGGPNQTTLPQAHRAGNSPQTQHHYRAGTSPQMQHRYRAGSSGSSQMQHHYRAGNSPQTQTQHQYLPVSSSSQIQAQYGYPRRSTPQGQHQFQNRRQSPSFQSQVQFQNRR